MAEGFKILDAYVEVRADASKVGMDAENQLRGQSNRLTSAGSGLGSALMGGMSGVIGGLVGGVVSAFAAPLVQGVQDALSQTFQAAKSAVIDYNSTLEQANIGFTTMLGSAGKAKDFISDLQTFAQKTPFAFSDLQDYSQQMIGYGVNSKKVIPYLTALGDAAAGAGKSSSQLGGAVLAFNQIAARGKVDLGDLNQLTNAGIPAVSILASKYHVSKDALYDMISAGKLASSDALPKLISGIEHGTKSTASFGGMMSKQSSTFKGAMSNIGDSFNQTLSTAGQPFYKLIEKLATKLSTFATSKGVQTWAKNTAKDLGSFFKDVEKGFKAIKADPEVQKSLKEFGAVFKQAMKDAGPELKKILPDLVKFAKDALPGVIDGLKEVVKAAPAVSKNLSLIFKQLGNSGKEFGDASRAVGTFVKNMFGFLNDLDHWADSTSHVWFKFRDKAIAAFNDLKAKLAGMGADMITGLINGIKSKVSDAVGTVKDLAGNIAGTFAHALGIRSPSKVFHQYGTWVGEGLQKGLLGSVDQVKAATAALAKAVDEPMRVTVEKVGKRLATLSAQRAKVTTALGSAKDKLSGLRDDRASYKQGVRDSIMGGADITGLFEAGTSTTTSSSAMSGSLDGRSYTGSYTTSSTTTTPGGLTGVREKLRKMVADTKAFTANLKKLVGMGLDHFSVQELIQAGPTVSLPITTELLNDKAGFNDLVSLQGQLNSASASLGTYGAGYTYNNQITDTKQRVMDLTSKQTQITAVMVIEANKIDEVHKVVKAVNALAKTAKAKKAVKK